MISENDETETEPTPEPTDEQQLDDDIVTIILPTIHNNQ